MTDDQFRRLIWYLRGIIGLLILIAIILVLTWGVEP
jgi:flagellin-like protein